MSVFAIDPVLLSMRGLKSIGPATRQGAEFCRHEDGAPRTRVRAAVKLPCSIAHGEPRARRREKRGICLLIAQNQHWLSDYALFRALKDRFKWTAWRSTRGVAESRCGSARGGPAAVGRPRSPAIPGFTPAHDSAGGSRIRREPQGADWRRHGILPFRMTAPRFGANQHLFDLDRTVGTPDTFNEKGQRWGCLCRDGTR